jgi:hypothetical protein
VDLTVIEGNPGSSVRAQVRVDLSSVAPFPVSFDFATADGTALAGIDYVARTGTIIVPAGFNAQGLPMGLQLIGKPKGDFELLQVAHAYEMAAQDLIQKRPPGL